jgi:hypothetical protein
MDRRWVGSDGCEIVLVMQDGRQVLRVRRHGRLVADCSSVEEVAGHVDLADLCEVIALPSRPAATDPARVRTSSHHR